MKRLLTRLLCLGALLLLTVLPALSQGTRVTGVVYDVDGTPMVGVSVTVAGTQKGDVTDLEGRFSHPERYCASSFLDTRPSKPPFHLTQAPSPCR